MSGADNPLGFSEQWFALGIVTQSQYLAHLSKFKNGGDTNTEHYRWGSFCGFMEKERDISSDTLVHLYRLGERDRDYTMGGAMMWKVLARPECPAELLAEAARDSDRKHLQKIANKKGYTI